MAGPLGEMFDHGEARTIEFVEGLNADLMVIICRVRRDEHDGERWSCEKKKKARRDQLVWICDVHIAEWTES